MALLFHLPLSETILEQLLSYEVTLAKKCKKPVSEHVKQRLLTKKGFLKSLFKVNDK